MFFTAEWNKDVQKFGTSNAIGEENFYKQHAAVAQLAEQVV